MAVAERVPLLMLHGWGMHGGVWAGYAGMAGERPCLAPDLPGYGGRPAIAPYRAESLARNLAECFAMPLVLCGWSMGGLLAMAWAAMFPEQVRALVLVSSTPAFRARADWPHGMTEALLDDFSRAVQADPVATLKRFIALQATGDVEQRRVLRDLRRLADAAPLAEEGVLSAGLHLLRDDDLRDDAARIACPTLVLHGSADALCPIEAGTWLAAHIPGATLATRPGAGHAPFISDPLWFKTKIEDFLRHVAS